MIINKLTLAATAGAMVLLFGYLVGAIMQENFHFVTWPLPPQLLVISFSVVTTTVVVLVLFTVKSEKEINKKSR
ncbi:hypothetical protein [Phytohalomonas tamaricis]|uniref:hypothetical protein n=1 Tax=Phytohalomonas tamaricis TaxID=2081032 RepID=UPI000D0BE941|nr:hypothetical protein [Phytohalomonas tamaricis]